MELISVEKKVGRYRQYLIVYARASGAQTTIHFTTPLDIPDPVDNDFAFIFGAMAAFIIGEDYLQKIAASQEIQENFEAVKKIWLSWHPHRKDIQIDVPVLERGFDALDREHLLDGSFFSGGVDSLFTAQTLGETVSALISIAHTPNDLEIIDHEFERLLDMRSYVEGTNSRHLLVASDFMTAFPEVSDLWAYLAHGAALSAIAHRLNAVLKSAVISSSLTYDQLIPWGSHPATDELLSSRSVGITHFGAESGRVTKTFAVCTDQTALDVISVCEEGRLDGKYVNCSECQKCLRTMATIDLAGTDKNLASTFDWSIYDPANLSSILLRDEGDIDLMQEIQDEAKQQNRPDIIEPIGQVIAKSRKLVFLAKMELYVRQRVKIVTHFKRPLLKIKGGVYRLLGLRNKIGA